MYQEKSERKISQEVDVVVIGGGPAGIGAALAAARNGAKTILAERYSFIGGNATMGMPLLGFLDMSGNQLIGGIAEELVKKLKKINGAIGPIRCPHHGSYVIVDPEKLKDICLQMVNEAGINLLLNSKTTDVLTKNNTVRAVVLKTKQGIETISAKVTIDTTGDGSIAVASGARFERGRKKDGLVQPPTLMFRMGNVDTKKIRQAIFKYPDRYQSDISPSHFKKNDHYVVVGLRNLIEKAKKEGYYPHNHPMNTVIFSTLLPRGEVGINMAKVARIDGSKPEELIRAEKEAKKQIPMLVNFFKRYVPGFESAHFIDAAHQIGIRETRRIIGEYVLTKEDVLDGKRFKDSIALGGYMIDIHPPEGGEAIPVYPKRAYGVPYRCLLPEKIENILVAGRCISTTHEALGSIRIIAMCIALGQAAGTAAALAAKNNITPRKLEIQKLQNKLTNQGAILGKDA